jgi:hypothetical protein
LFKGNSEIYKKNLIIRRVPEAIIIAEHESPRKETLADGLDTLNYLVPSCPKYHRPQSAIIGMKK